MTTTIKRIGLADKELVTGLFNSYRVFYKQQPDMQLAKAFISERLGNNESVIFVALRGDVPVGFTQLYPKYSSVSAVKNWILNDLYVDEAYREQGIAKLLINATLDFARVNKSRYVQLETATDNYNAQALYEQSGFEQQAPDTEFVLYKFTL